MLRTDLIDLINSGEMWAFVGSGASIDSGGPSWSELVQGTIECLDESKKQEINRRYQAAFSKEDYAKCFSIIEKSTGRELLENLVADQLKSVKSPGKITNYLADWPFAGYITTNYDELIKNALQRIQEHGWAPIGNLPDEARQISGNVKQVIWHVHGSTSLPNSQSRLMLTEEDYEDFYLDSSPVTEKLRGLLMHKRIVFIGFGFEDPEIKRLLKYIGKLCSPAYPAFAFLSGIYGTEYEQERIELLEKYNVDVIPYREINRSHEQLHQLFDFYNSFILSRSLKFGQPTRPCPSYDPETTSLLVYNELALRNESNVTENVLKSLLKSRILSILQYRESITIEELCLDLDEKIRIVNGDSYKDSLDKSYETILQCIGELYQENFISGFIPDNKNSSVYLSQKGLDHIADQTATAKRLSSQFSASLQDRARVDFQDDPEAIVRIAQTAETFLKECIQKRGLGVAMSWYSPDADFQNFHIVALLQALPEYINQLLTPEEGIVLIRLIEDILSKPNEVEAKFLGISLQAQFGVHILGCDAQTFQTRVRELSRTLFLIDSSTLIPLLGRSNAGYYPAQLLLDHLNAVKSAVATTQMLSVEVAEHARWGITHTKQDNSFYKPETLILTTGRAGTRSNVFFEGFLEEVNQGTIPRDFGAYLDSICGHPNGHLGRDEDFIAALQNINIACLDLEEWEGFTQELWNERDELQEKITERRIKNQTYRHERQVKAEAEAVIIIRNLRNKNFSINDREFENAYFISNTRIIDDIDPRFPITMRPEAVTQWLSTVTPCNPEELGSLFSGLFWELSEHGLAIINKSTLQTAFAPLVTASTSQLQEEVKKHQVLISQRYGENADKAFSKVNDLDIPIVMHSFYAQRVETLEQRLKKVASQQKNLNDDERHELEIFRSERAYRKRRELKRQRALESRPKGKRKKKKKKKKPSK